MIMTTITLEVRGHSPTTASESKGAEQTTLPSGLGEVNVSGWPRKIRATMSIEICRHRPLSQANHRECVVSKSDGMRAVTLPSNHSSSSSSDLNVDSASRSRSPSCHSSDYNLRHWKAVRYDGVLYDVWGLSRSAIWT